MINDKFFYLLSHYLKRNYLNKLYFRENYKDTYFISYLIIINYI